MAQTKNKLRKSEVALLKDYCARLSDEDLQTIASLLPQNVAFDRAIACDMLQEDKEIDKWLTHSASADDWFSRVDSIGEAAAVEIDVRSKKSMKTK